MAFAQVNGARCYYRVEGQRGRPVVVLAHSLGLDHTMFDPQVADLASAFQVVRYDLRGHGASDAPGGEYALEELGHDALGLLDHLASGPVHWCGVSLGGFVGQWLAVNAGDRLASLVLADTTARVADPASMEARRHTVLVHGMDAIVDTAMSRFFLASIFETNPACVASARAVFLATNPIGYAGCCAALRDADLTAVLGQIRTRTLVIGGEADASMPWEQHGAVLARDIPGATAVRMPTAHLSNLGQPRTFTRALFEFFGGKPADDYDAGLRVRRQVLGDDYVDRSLASATDLTRDFQELITRYAWGAVWARPGLDRRTRRMLVLATTAALGRWEEFRLHLGAGLDHDLEWSDVEEVLLQTAVYAGVPAANTAFHIAAEERARRA